MNQRRKIASKDQMQRRGRSPGTFRCDREVARSMPVRASTGARGSTFWPPWPYSGTTGRTSYTISAASSATALYMRIWAPAWALSGHRRSPRRPDIDSDMPFASGDDGKRISQHATHERRPPTGPRSVSWLDSQAVRRRQCQCMQPWSSTATPPPRPASFPPSSFSIAFSGESKSSSITHRCRQVARAAQ